MILGFTTVRSIISRRNNR